jgi:hypothetical protein
MGRALKCLKCKGPVRVLAVMKDGKVDKDREARMCSECGYLEKRSKVHRPRITQES